MKVLTYFVHTLLIFFMLANKDFQGIDFAVMQGFQMAVRFSFIPLFVACL